ncbi:membrane protein involved in colicin uptake [Paraburkholderia sp. Clong3]|uniref:DUF6496 domain-containing protein n=1 Tax=unclassified Paraburkholderia TaxID=2615204 RepID=UPI0016120A5E|nr:MULTISPECIES: DUF6496 domain-containing protein [unclassified Paraburkholderia]MBB5464621.1 membrane protein involved in colicin uptake [Paraburkholderia sp. CI2]MBC8741557.1 DNA-binding protein [Paraburkholderia sp. UCT31]
MPEQKTLKRAEADKRAGKSASTQAGEFVKEQVDKVRAGKHGVRSPKQAIAIGLSEARRAGVDVKPPKKGATSEATRKKAQKDSAAGKHEGAAKKSASKESSAKRSRVSESVLERESKAGASSAAMSKQAKSAAAKRPAASRSAAAKKAAATKGAAGRSAAAKKAAQTRASRAHH